MPDARSSLPSGDMSKQSPWKLYFDVNCSSHQFPRYDVSPEISHTPPSRTRPKVTKRTAWADRRLEAWRERERERDVPFAVSREPPNCPLPERVALSSLSMRA